MTSLAKEFGGLKPDQVRRAKAWEKENERLRKAVGRRITALLRDAGWRMNVAKSSASGGRRA